MPAHPMTTSRTRAARVTPFSIALAFAFFQPQALTAQTPAEKKVVVYCSIDEAVARQVLDAFKTKTGIDVSTIYDSEAGKTTGLVQRIIRESQAGRPRADVFWSSELFNTILLARMDLLDPYDSPQAADIPPRFRDQARRWTALAVRARVLGYDPHATPESQLPARWEELAEASVAKRSAIANPLFGTTRGHVASMFVLWGPDRAKSFLTRLRDAGTQVVDGNSATVRAVIGGRAAFAWTDTDDVFAARGSGASMGLHYPDMGGGGTLLIPCSVAVLRGGPNPTTAKSLADFLVSAVVERMLAQSEAAFIPVRDRLRTELNMKWPPETPVVFDEVADFLDDADAAVREILIR